MVEEEKVIERHAYKIEGSLIAQRSDSLQFYRDGYIIYKGGDLYRYMLEEQEPVFRIASRRRKESGISGKTPASTLTKSRSFREKELIIGNINNTNLEQEIMAQELNSHSRIYFLLSTGNFLRDHLMQLHRQQTTT